MMLNEGAGSPDPGAWGWRVRQEPRACLLLCHKTKPTAHGTGAQPCWRVLSSVLMPGGTIKRLTE